MSNLFEQLKTLKNIGPDARFTAQSRQTILNTPGRGSVNRFYYSRIKQQFYEGLSFAMAVGLAALLVYLSVSFINQTAPAKLVKREPAPDFNISLENARYYKEVAPNVYIVVLGNKD